MGEKCKPLYCVCGCKIPQRVVVATFCVLGVIVAYGQRASINVAITRIVSAEVRNKSHDCPLSNQTLAGEGITGGSHDWSETIQEYILHAFYVGYFIGQIPCGISADLIGGKWTYFSGIAISSIVTLMTPLIINYMSWYYVYVSRVIAGIVQSVTYPSMSALVAHWVPFTERATLGAFSFSSNALGTVFGNLLSGLVMNYTKSWRNTFYFWAGMGFLWCILFFLFIFDTPQKHPHITESEKVYLEEVMPKYVKLKVPWKPLLVDNGIWALIIGQIGHDFTFYLMVTNMPKYFSDVLHMTVRDISLITSLPFIGLWLISISSGKIIDYGIKKKNWSVKWSRRVATYISFVIPNTFLCLMVYCECKILLAALCFIIATLLKGPHFAGFKVNHMDITVNFNGIVMSLINTSGCIGGFIAPLIVSYVAPNNTLKEWKIVTWIIFGLACFFTTYYLFMAQAERAKWDVPDDELDEYNKEKERKIAAKPK